MTLEGEQGVIAHHPATVVGDLDELFASSLDLNLDSCGTGIERILQQFLDHRGRALDHFTGSDLIGNVFGKDVNAAHGIG